MKKEDQQKDLQYVSMIKITILYYKKSCVKTKFILKTDINQ